MSGAPFESPYAFFVDLNGVPYVNGALYFYITGTDTPQNTYADVGLTTPNSNPVIANAAGLFPSIWLGSANAYKVVLEDQYGNQIWTADPWGPAAGGGAASAAGILGEVRAFAGLITAIPADWYLCYGQAVSRTTYAAAFAVLGTIWGAGDGSTTFNLPDLRGRGLLGVDTMGGTAAGRITSGVSGISGATLGATGGSQNAQQDTLTAASTVTDPGHTHTYSMASNTTAYGGTNATSPQDFKTLTNLTTSNATTGITVETTVESALTGTSQNVQPSAMIYWIIYLGA